MPAKPVEDQNYIKGIKEGNPKVIRQIYEHFHKAIVHLVESQRGTIEDANDVFQEGLVVLYQKVQDANFELSSSFLTYFYAVCRNIWYNKLRKKNKKEVTIDEKMLTMLKEEETPLIEQSEQYFLYRKMFLRLGPDCQKVLDLFLQKVSMEEIRQKMGYSSVSYTKKRKFLCKEQLVNAIKGDPRFRELSMNPKV
ncbi:MAG: sigma-70 family RNA polymerase sigma factor [Bacteroidota bacterium]